MIIIEVIGIKLGQQPIMWAARNEREANLLCGLIQEQGGIPCVREAEAPDDFNDFALDLPGVPSARTQPSIN